MSQYKKLDYVSFEWNLEIYKRYLKTTQFHIKNTKCNLLNTIFVTCKTKRQNLYSYLYNINVTCSASGYDVTCLLFWSLFTAWCIFGNSRFSNLRKTFWSVSVAEKVKTQLGESESYRSISYYYCRKLGRKRRHHPPDPS